MSEVERIRGIQPGWASFLWAYIHLLSYEGLESDYEGALNTLKNLCNFLPTDVKNGLSEELALIDELDELFGDIERRFMNEKCETPFEMSRASYRCKAIKNSIAKAIVREITRKLMEILDEKGYLEVRERKLPSGHGLSW